VIKITSKLFRTAVVYFTAQVYTKIIKAKNRYQADAQGASGDCPIKRNGLFLSQECWYDFPI